MEASVETYRQLGFWVVARTWNHGPDVYIAHFDNQDDADARARAEAATIPAEKIDGQRREWIEVHQPHTRRVLCFGPVIEM